MVPALATLAILNAIALPIDAQEPNAPPIEARASSILVDRCVGCHSGKNAQGGLAMTSIDSLLRANDSGSPAIVPGKPDESELYQRILSDDPTVRMPSEGERLTDEERDAIRSWIEQSSSSLEDQRSLAMLASMQDTQNRQAKPIVEHYEQSMPVASIAVGPSPNVYAGGIGELLRWNWETTSLDERVAGFSRRIGAVDRCKADGSLAVASGRPGLLGNVVVLHPGDTSTKRQTIAFDSDISIALAFAPNGPTLLMGTLEGRIRLFDCNQSSMLLDSAAHADQVLAVAWKSDGSEFITGSRDRTARVYAYPSLELQSAYAGHERTVGGVGICDFGALTLDETGALRLWQHHEDRVLAVRTGLPQRIQPLALRNNYVAWLDGHRVQISRVESYEEQDGKNEDGTPKMKRKHRFAHAYVLSAPKTKSLTCVQWLDDQRLIAGTSDGQVVVLNTAEPDRSSDPSASHRVLP